MNNCPMPNHYREKILELIHCCDHLCKLDKDNLKEGFRKLLKEYEEKEKGSIKDNALTVDVHLKSEADAIIFADTLKGNIVKWYRSGGPLLRLAVEFDLIWPAICSLDALASKIRAQTIDVGIPTKFPDGTFKAMP